MAFTLPLPDQSEYVLRPLEYADAAMAEAITHSAFDDLRARLSMPPWPQPEEAERVRRTVARMRHAIATDGGGCWCASDGDTLVGVAIAIKRATLWGLSLLVVDPAHQGTGVGQRLLRQALAYADGCSGGMIISSPDPRAFRAYTAAGFDLRPCTTAMGQVERKHVPGGLGVRDDLEPDLDLIDLVDGHVRGRASHRPDIELMIDSGGRYLEVDDRDGRGYAVVENGPLLLAATSPEVAQRLLWSAIALTAPGDDCTIKYMDVRQQWAVTVVTRAHLPIGPFVGGVMVRGEVGRLTPYLPSGTLL